MEKKTYETVAHSIGLDPKTASVYVKHMKHRWSAKEELNCICGYAEEWARRFAMGQEWIKSDTIGQDALRQIDPECYRG